MSNEIRHHLSDELLMAYSAGSLPEAFSLITATHISMCDICRARLESYDAIGGAVVEDCTGESPLDDTALAATLALIEQTDVPPASVPARSAVLPVPLMSYVGGDVDDIRWRPVGMGVKQAILPTSPEATARMLLIPAGSAVPDHGHRGTELTLVLKGAFSDEFDRFARGDIEIATEEDEHMPVADFGEDCICLAVTDARLRFSGLIPRLFQPFLRI